MTRQTLTGLAMLLGIASGTNSAWAQCRFGWAEGFGPPGMNGPVHATAVFNDGSGDALYAGGYFTTAGEVVANYIAKWDGTRWSPLGAGMAGGGHEMCVNALVVFDDDGSGPNPPALYAGGRFTTAGGVSVNHIAKWDGTSWSPLGLGASSTVYALVVFDDGTGPALYAGGSFYWAGGIEVNGIAKWDGTTWSALGTGVSGGEVPTVLSLAVFDAGSGAALHAGGWFTMAGGVPANGFAKWDGSAWSAMDGWEGFVTAVAFFDGGGGSALHVGGNFTLAGGVSANYTARWDGTSWAPLGSGMHGGVRALTVYSGELMAGGEFTSAGGVSASYIARWDGTSWAPLGSAMNGSVKALAIYNGELIAAGYFTTAGGVSAMYIARWDGTSWSPLGAGNGMNDSVSALTAFDDGGGDALYAGGDFTAAGKVDANYIAKWDGTSWSPLGSGMGGGYVTVNALTVFDDDGAGPRPAALYAGGCFTTAGGVTGNRIARWDGTSWSALASGMNDCVSALAVFDDGGGAALYAGGYFTTAGGVTVNRIARWDGTSWSALGSGMNVGMNKEVYALTSFDDDGPGPNPPKLYAGVSAQYKRGFEANEVPPWFNAAPAGVVLTGPLPPGTPPSQDLFYIPPFSFDYFCYTYAGNTLNVPPHPTGGGSQFVAGTAQGGTAHARAQRDVSWGTGLWMAAYDVVVPYPPVPHDNLGSFSVQPHEPWSLTAQSMVQVFKWVDAGYPELGWRAPYNRYDANGNEFRYDLPGPAWKNLVFGHWYRFKTLLDFDTHKFYAVTIRNLNVGTSDFLYPTGWYLLGGAAGAPIPTGFRFFSGGSGGGNTVAWDNLCIGKVADLNCDGKVDFDDIDPFVLALTDPGGYEVQYPGCCIDLADCNGDGTVDFDDIDPFVTLLSGG